MNDDALPEGVRCLLHFAFHCFTPPWHAERQACRCAVPTPYGAESLLSVREKPERPSFCVSYQATEEFCGTSRNTALKQLSSLEVMTAQKKRSAIMQTFPHMVVRLPRINEVPAF